MKHNNRYIFNNGLTDHAEEITKEELEVPDVPAEMDSKVLFDEVVVNDRVVL